MKKPIVDQDACYNMNVTLADVIAQHLRAFIDTLTNVERVEVLPYHTLGVYKWRELGLRYSLDGVPTPTKEEVRKAENILCKRPSEK